MMSALVGVGIGYLAGNEHARTTVASWAEQARTSPQRQDLEDRASATVHKLIQRTHRDQEDGTTVATKASKAGSAQSTSAKRKKKAS